MRKNVENQDDKICPGDTDGSVHCQHCSRLQNVDRRLGKWSKLLKFLLFKEDQPKHSVWSDFKPIHLGLVIPLAVMPSVGLVVAGLYFGGVIGFFVAYAVAIVFAIEVPHCIFDR